MLVNEKYKKIKSLSNMESLVYNEAERQFYPLKIEPIFDDENNFDGLWVIATTGKFEVGMCITEVLLNTCKSIKELSTHIKKRLHHDIERRMFSERYKETLKNKTLLRYNYMVDTCMIPGEVIVCVHPQEHMQFLKYEAEGFDSVISEIRGNKHERDKI